MSEAQPQARPLVSILCRTMNRPELKQAIASIQEQDYTTLELVLVDATGQKLVQKPVLPGSMRVTLCSSDQALDRPRAANVALDHATGDLLLFLDEDDWIAPDHIANLVDAHSRISSPLAAYSSVRAATQTGELLEQCFRAGFDQHLLMRDNYIPIHAVLFSRRLLDLGCRFDESLPIYEDWDFWQQCAQHAPFFHIDKVTAFYRQGGQSATALQDESEKFRPGSATSQARIAVLQKWLPRWSAADLNAVLGTMDNSAFVKKLEDELRATFRHREDLLRQLDEKRGALERAELQIRDRDLQLADQRSNLEARIAQLEAHLRDREAQLSALCAEHTALSAHLQVMTNSNSWRITRPLRWLGRQVRAFRRREPNNL